MTSPFTTATGSQRYAVDSSRLIKLDPAPAIRADTPEARAFMAEMKRVAAAAEAPPDPVLVAKNRAVQAHTVFRQNGQIIAAVWRDGQSQMTNALGAKLDWPSMEKRTAGMTDAQRRDYIAQQIVKHMGPGVTVERYGESGAAPTRGAINDEQNKANIKERRRLGLEIL
ncbi:hypothetical protein [Azospirillum soli]|uniref:hypothetical protein n=1 Tax=Azospirillum soli TaxID=1304799 RepID=UPI001AE87981|nr:hypothetical protein [Azospirillum soli]MBP2313319.1 hypothetical protein [Azospirillum soli]